VFSVPEVVAAVQAWRALGRTIVFTNGVFDLLHPGHVRYLQQARDLGDVLIVGLNSDRSARGNKGDDRPIPAEAERAEVLAALNAWTPWRFSTKTRHTTSSRRFSRTFWSRAPTGPPMPSSDAISSRRAAAGSSGSGRAGLLDERDHCEDKNVVTSTSTSLGLIALLKSAISAAAWKPRDRCPA
jgi:cytidyltransferase-like protein